MTDKTVLVSGATGRQGGAVVGHLLERGFPVRAITRDPERPAARALAARGVHVVKGDLEDVPSLRAALEGVGGVFSVQNFWDKGTGYEGEIRQARNLAQAATEANVSHFVQSSVAGCDNAPGVRHFQSKWEIEKMVDSLGLPRTFLRPVFFMENFIDRRIILPGLAGALKPDTSLHMISVDDIGWFVAAAFADPAVYLGQTVDLAGDTLTVEGIKRVYAKVSGKSASNLKVPSLLTRLLSSENARQLRWNNEIGWRFDIGKAREINPGLVSFEMFLRSHPKLEL
jgi:uncharacterized protein YbjT (DUF2867 family)